MSQLVPGQLRDIAIVVPGPNEQRYIDIGSIGEQKNRVSVSVLCLLVVLVVRGPSYVLQGIFRCL